MHPTCWPWYIIIRNRCTHNYWQRWRTLNVITRLSEIRAQYKIDDSSSLKYIVIHSKYFPNSDWLKAHA